MIDLNQSALNQIAALSSGKISSVELLDAYISAESQTNASLNAIVAKDIEGARKKAKEIDARRSAGEDVGPLQGLPITVKDSFDVEGMPAICGNPALLGREQDVADAEIVAMLKQAGAVVSMASHVIHMTCVAPREDRLAALQLHSQVV